MTAKLRIYSDAKVLTTINGGTCIHSGFGYQDVVECATNGTAPKLAVNRPFILVLGNRKLGKICVIKMTPNVFRNDCTTPLSFDDDNMEDILNELGIDLTAAYNRLYNY